MSDVTYFLQIPGARLASVEHAGDTVRLHFACVELLQEMENAFNDSLWTQAISMEISSAEIDGALPECPCVMSGGDLTDNIFTYRNHAPLPIDWHGEVRLSLLAEGTASPFTISGNALRVVQHEHPRYIRHIDKG